MFLRHRFCSRVWSCISLSKFIVSVLSSYLCKVLLGDPPSPLDAQLEWPAGVRHICALDQHPLDQQAVLWRVFDVSLTFTVTAQALWQHRQNIQVQMQCRSVSHVYCGIHASSLQYILALRRYKQPNTHTHTQAYVWARLFYGSHRLVDAVHKLVDVLKVSGHLCGQHHVNDGLTQCSELRPVSKEQQSVRCRYTSR